MTVSYAVWGLNGQAHSTWGFLPCPTCTVISLDSLNLFSILCMVLGERPTLFAIVHCEMWFLTCFFIFVDISLVKFGIEWWAMIQLCLHRCLFFTQTWYLDILPIHLLTVQVNNNVAIILFFYNFASVPTFLECVAVVKNQMCLVHIYQNTFTLVSENFGNLFFVLLSIK